MDAPAAVRLPASIRDPITAAARAVAPLEMCGLVVGSDVPAAGGRPLRWVPTRNAAASPYVYEVDPADLVRVSLEIDARDEALWAIVHSHVASPGRPSPTDKPQADKPPSPTDIRQAFDPEALYLIVSLAAAEADPATGAPSLRCWRITGGEAVEVALEVEE
jgi:proteasome lid subunit RPN8/RPN11